MPRYAGCDRWTQEAARTPNLLCRRELNQLDHLAVGALNDHRSQRTEARELNDLRL
jgi:hypothetical protein